MDKEQLDELQEENQEELQEEMPRYSPRPRWQVWIARLGLVLFIIMIILYYIHMMRGGM